MYLRKVELRGFKTFANRTEMEFGPGITAIVGPNGVGKSNFIEAVELLHACQEARRASQIPAGLLTLGVQVTDCNAAFFDAANGFAGCIAGIHEVLR